MSRLNPSVLTVAALLAWGGVSAVAQTPAKPAATKPAATTGGEAKTLGGGTSTSGKVLGINELKECLKRQDDLKVRGTELERERAAADSERQKIEQETAGVKAQQDEIAKRNDAVKDFNVRMKALGDSVTSWNARSAELADATGTTADRRRRELAAEMKTLQKTEADYKVEGESLMAALQDAVKQANTRAEGQQKLATDWNDRNAKLIEAVNTYENSRVDWREECGNRRYREDDEKALRSSK